MKHRIGILFALAGSFLLAGCGAIGKLEPVALPIIDHADLAGKGMAVVVLSAGQATSTARGARRMAIAAHWASPAQPGKADTGGIILTADDEAHPHVAQVRAGTYKLQSFTFGTGAQTFTSMAGMRGLPLAAFTLAPGDILYVGHLLVQTKRGAKGLPRAEFRLVVESHSAPAQAQLTRRLPSLAELMQTRLMSLNPLLTTLNGLPRRNPRATHRPPPR